MSEPKLLNYRVYEEIVQGGTPFEKGIQVDPRIGRKESSVLMNLISANKQPRMCIRLASPTKEQKELLDTLPESIVCNTPYIQYLSFYRQVLADKLLRDQTDPQSTEPVHCPLLCILPDVLEQPDLMDILRMAWAEKLKLLKRSDKKDGMRLKEMFNQVFMESVYPLYSLADLESYSVADTQQQSRRAALLQRCIQMNRYSAVASLMSADVMHKPFDMTELSFSVVQCRHPEVAVQ